ncbi:MAG: hypothetical protein ABSG67_19510 [Thermoguttaceae bacterium]|jgi:hypothetical protein
MKKAAKNRNAPKMQKEYDFSKGVRGKYHKRFTEGSNVVVIEAELSRIFPDSRSVNRALRSLVSIARKSTEKPK